MNHKDKVCFRPYRLTIKYQRIGCALSLKIDSSQVGTLKYLIMDSLVNKTFFVVYVYNMHESSAVQLSYKPYRERDNQKITQHYDLKKRRN